MSYEITFLAAKLDKAKIQIQGEKMKAIFLGSFIFATSLLISGTSMATSLCDMSDWQISPDYNRAGFINKKNKSFEFGTFTVDENNNVSLNKILGDIYTDPTLRSFKSDEYFGFYVKKGDRIWLSDDAIRGLKYKGESSDLYGLRIAKSEFFQVDYLDTLAGERYKFYLTSRDGRTLFKAVGSHLCPVETVGDSNTVASVPEPATMLLFGTGLVGLAGLSRKKKK